MGYLSITNLHLSEVKAALSETSNNLSQLCTSDNINKWSRWKPIRSSVATMTLDEIKAQHCGLQPVSLGSSPTEWTYLKPTGGASSPYRLGDFRNYDHDATVPCGVFSDIGISVTDEQLNLIKSSSDIQTYFDNTTGYLWTLKSNQQTIWTMYATTIIAIKCRLYVGGTDNYISIGGTDFDKALPLNELASFNQGYRLGLLCNTKGSTAQYLITGLCPFGLGGNEGDYEPSFITNTYLATLLRSTKLEIEAIPCLVRNSLLMYNATDGVYVSVNNADILSVPNGLGKFTLRKATSYTMTITVTYTAVATACTINSIAISISRDSGLESLSLTSRPYIQNNLAGDYKTASVGSPVTWSSSDLYNRSIALVSGGYGEAVITVQKQSGKELGKAVKTFTPSSLGSGSFSATVYISGE